MKSLKRAIHHLSNRSGGPFVALNCGALRAELLENEMFGHEAGAFTGAAGTKPGLAAEADGGTLFLDEIDSLPAQAMLLRFLQEGEFKPLGSSKTKMADVRVIAATNMDIREALSAHSIREDLLYRLCVMWIHLPPLRERKDDIPILVGSFVQKWATRFGKAVDKIEENALELLTLHDWPGNVRELENTIERAVILAEKSTIQAEDILFLFPKARNHGERSYRDLKYEFEGSYLRRVLSLSRGNVSKAAQVAKLDRRTFRLLLGKHEISIPSVSSFHQ